MNVGSTFNAVIGNGCSEREGGEEIRARKKQSINIQGGTAGGKEKWR